MKDNNDVTITNGMSFFHDGRAVPDLLTTAELILFLRIPEISKAKDCNNVVDNLVRMRGLPRIQLCNKLLFSRQAVLEWVNKQTIWN
jgi:hypothetical protein